MSSFSEVELALFVLLYSMVRLFTAVGQEVGFDPPYSPEGFDAPFSFRGRIDMIQLDLKPGMDPGQIIKLAVTKWTGSNLLATSVQD